MLTAERRRSSRRAGWGRKSRLGLWTAIAFVLLVSAYAGVLELSRPHVGGDRLRFDTFVSLAGGGRIIDVKLLDEDAYAVGRYVADDGSEAFYNTPLLRGTQGDLLQLLVEQNIPTVVEQQVGKRMASLATMLLPGLILILLFVYLILSFRRGTGLFGIRSGARRIRGDEVGVSFSDVAGQDAAIAELQEISGFLADRERFSAVGATVPKGVLLYGPPGCGKTLLARALAGEAGARFYSISGSDFVELYVGVGASRVRELFREAREHAPALIFIDELDSIGRARSAKSTTASEGEQEHALNQILTEMDGFSPSEGVIVVAATNRPDILDQALLRPGRFDRSIGLERPDAPGRLAILSLHARGKQLVPGTDLQAIALKAIGLTGADLAAVMNEAALLAARAGDAALAQPHLDAALTRILEAPERQRRLSLTRRSIGRRSTAEERITFSHVAGIDDAVSELAEVRDYLSDPDRFARVGARVPRGILLAGPPGCGKTLLARALAGEANAAFLSVSGSGFVESFAGEGAARVRDLFAEARSLAPSIIFVDEIDAIGGRRSVASLDGHGEQEQTLNQILIELDGFEARGGVIVMAATNRPDILDPALVRAGRFDRQVTIAPPDRGGRLAILALHASSAHLSGDVDLEVAAGLTRGFSGADLANVLNEAALLAAREGLAEVTMAMVEEAIDRTALGVAAKGTIMSEDERRVVAYHEAGHALVARALPGAVAPHRLTIVPRGPALGRCTVLDTQDALVRSRSSLLDEMSVCLGGRVAEDLVFGEPGTAAASDLQRAAGIARQMVCQLGMSDAAGLAPSVDGLGPERGGGPHSEHAARTVETEVRRLMDEAYGRAEMVLVSCRFALDRVARALLERETLAGSELEQVTALARVSQGNGRGAHTGTAGRSEHPVLDSA